MWKQILAASSGMLLATAAMADATAVSTGNLNIRGGPGTNYHVQGLIAVGSPVTVFGCLNNTSWCFVNFGGMEGWSSARWLSMQSGTPTTYAWTDLGSFPRGSVTAYASTNPGYTTTYASTYGSNYYGSNYYGRGGRIGDGRGLFGRPRLIGGGYGY